jgi:flagellar basal-body rod protein FlgB
VSDRRTLAVDSTPLAGLDRLSQHLRFLGERQGVLAGNLANIDTPGFRAKDVEFTERFDQLTTEAGTQRQMSFETEAVTRDDEVPDQDGNTVSLETQIARMDENTLQFRSLAELLSRRIGMLRYAANDGRG